MSPPAKSLGTDQPEFDVRLPLVGEGRTGIVADANGFPLTPAQPVELDRRIADDDQFPDDVVPWSDVKTSLCARLRG